MSVCPAARLEADYHHFIFGQRGSGKSSLLRHLQRQMVDANRVAVWIDQEINSKLSYPDVLVSALHELMKSLAATLERKIASESQPQRRFAALGRKQADTPQTQLLFALHTAATELEKLKFAPLNRKIEWKIVEETSQSSKTTAGVRMQLVSLQGDAGSAEHTAATASEIVDGTKEYLERALTGYRDLITRTSELVGGGFVFVDDLYQIQRNDQPEVLGYLRLVKDTGLWLEVGSIRYSTGDL